MYAISLQTIRDNLYRRCKMKFYCLYDLLDYYRIRQNQERKEMYHFFARRGYTKASIDFLRNTCSINSTPGFIQVVSEYTGLTELEINLSLGIIPEEYKTSFFENVHKIANLLEEAPCNSGEKNITPFFLSQQGVLYNADCVDVLKQQPSESVDLVFADPPFNLKKEYDSGINDDLSMSEYLAWCYSWIDECIRILKPGGSLYIYNIPKWGTYFADFLNKRLTFRSWIGVNMKFSLPLAGRLYPAHYALLYYVKGEKPATYNSLRVPIETCRHCGGELHDYGGYKSKMNPNGVNLSDIWSDIFPVRHKKTKNRSFNELSVKMLDRIISMSTKLGDTVFDPFGGSGTTYVVAELLGRRWIGCELGNCTIIKERFENIDKDRELLNQVQKEKNIIFTEKATSLRKRNGFWLSTDFHK